MQYTKLPYRILYIHDFTKYAVNTLQLRLPYHVLQISHSAATSLSHSVTYHEFSIHVDVMPTADGTIQLHTFNTICLHSIFSSKQSRSAVCLPLNVCAIRPSTAAVRNKTLMSCVSTSLCSKLGCLFMFGMRWVTYLVKDLMTELSLPVVESWISNYPSNARWQHCLTATHRAIWSSWSSCWWVHCVSI